MNRETIDKELDRLEEIWPYLSYTQQQQILNDVRKGVALSEFKQLVNGDTNPVMCVAVEPVNAHWIRKGEK